MSSLGRKQASLTPSERSQRWNPLFQRQLRHAPHLLSSSSSSASSNDKQEKDPFDCTDILQPSSQDLIDQHLQETLPHWEHLDARKIPMEASPPLSSNLNSNSNSNSNSNLKRKYGFNDDDAMHRLRLPHHFDYQSRHPPTTTSTSSPSHTTTFSPPQAPQQQVISLLNPMETVEYESELWKLFNSVPTHDYFQRPFNDASPVCPHIKRLNQEATQALKEYTRVDAHGLARMRFRDYHSLPSVSHRTDRSLSKWSSTSSSSNENHDNTITEVSMIRLECWRTELVRGSGVANDKLEMELEGTQTLYDVHKAIVQQSKDDFDNSNTAVLDAGMFFMEHCFYITGNENYALPILEWIQSSQDEWTSRARKEYLGLSLSPQDDDTPFPVKLMKEVRLQDVPFRIGVRYCHIFHGDLESSLFFTNVTTLPTPPSPQRVTIPRAVPSILDPWSSSIPAMICNACHHAAAVVVCANDEFMVGSGGGNNSKDQNPSSFAKLCHECFYKLHYDHPGKDHGNEVEEGKGKDVGAGAVAGAGTLRYNNFECFPISFYAQELSLEHVPIDQKF